MTPRESDNLTVSTQVERASNIEAPSAAPRSANFIGADGLSQLGQVSGYGAFAARAVDSFRARLTVVELDQCRHVSLIATAHTFSSTSHDATADVAELFYLLFGSLTGSQDGRTVDVHAGRPYLLRSSAPFAYTAVEPTNMVRITIPRHLLPAESAHRLRYATALEFPPSVFATAALAFITALNPNETPAPSEQQALQATIIALIHGLITSTTAPATGDTAVRAAIDATIRDNLDDPTLSPTNLAQQLGISLRQLHRYFEAEQTTAAAYIRNLRLDAIADELAASTTKPNRDYLSAKYGFTSSDVASRAFKRRFRSTMYDYRLTQHTLAST